MSCIVPPSITSPFLHNSIVSDLQNDIAGLSWLDNIYPVADVGEYEFAPDDRRLIPVVHKQDGTADYIHLFPDGDIRSGMFFEIQNGDYTVQASNDEVTITMNMVFFAQLKRIANRNYDFTDELIQTVLAALRAGTYGSEIIEYRVIKDKNLVYEKYGYTYEQLKQFGYPYTAFKIQFDLVADYSFDCNPAGGFDASYSPSCP